MIFDSNSLISTLVAAYSTDVIRIQYQESLLLHSQQYRIWGSVASWLSVVLSSCLIMEPDWMHNAYVSMQSPLHITLHVLFLATASQVPTHDEHRAHHDQIMLRSFVFLAICIVWTYTVGINNMVDLLGTSCR